MNTKLWDNIEKFDLDNPISEYGFTTRLAHENFWTKQFTETAIAEYRKFMYLAASSDWMVSPSAIVDTIWHQHLIFTQSYNDFCTVIGKQVQHIPSTHNRNEFEKFKLAKERTTKLYNDVFGEQPKEIWDYADMYDSLELPKAKLKIRAFVLIAILAFAVLFVPCYYLLRPLYEQINNPYFIVGFIAISIATFLGLETFNRNYLASTMEQFKDVAFINKLQPFELVYLKTQKLSNVIHGTINQLIDNNVIVINSDNTIEHTLNLKASNIEEHQVLDTLHHLGTTPYPILVNQLLTKPVFTNIANCMDALKKYYTKSQSFGRLFYSNFAMLATLLMIGAIRLTTGVLRDKPVLQIFIVLLILTTVIIGYLWRLTTRFCTQTIPNFYKQSVLPNTEDNFQWQYFLFGNAVLSTSFVPLVNYVDRRMHLSSDGGVSSCGSSDGSSCGSSCSSCGGCGGD